MSLKFQIYPKIGVPVCPMDQLSRNASIKIVPLVAANISPSLSAKYSLYIFAVPKITFSGIGSFDGHCLLIWPGLTMHDLDGRV